jgi:hypothetical protein
MKWANVGVGRLYRSFTLMLYLVDGRGKVACSVVGRADPREWLPGEHTVVEEMAIPAGLEPGAFGLALGLVAPETKRPAVKLAIDAPETGRRYRVGRLVVE